ncbi:MAG TPA: hypothetical protein VJQ06_09360 [Rhizomicrobium sp.]|nr:hypothetical protein [Rhizomicrobium sp.]
MIGATFLFRGLWYSCHRVHVTVFSELEALDALVIAMAAAKRTNRSLG